MKDEGTGTGRNGMVSAGPPLCGARGTDSSSGIRGGETHKYVNMFFFFGGGDGGEDNRSRTQSER